MSTRYNDGSHFYENHQRAAELHDGAAHAHRVAEQQGKEDHQTGQEHSRQALEHSPDAHEHSHSTKSEHGIAAFGHNDIAALAHQLWQARGSPEKGRRKKIGFAPRKNCDLALASPDALRIGSCKRDLKRKRLWQAKRQQCLAFTRPKSKQNGPWDDLARGGVLQ